MKQHSTPILITGGTSVSLERITFDSKDYNERWITDVCFRHENILPVNEIEPVFGGMIPICKELVTESGAVDLVYLNDSGYITIGEFKLWRNPEARRRVIGQVLDYAKDLAKWDYPKFEAACLKARKGTENKLFDIINENYPETEESVFIDNVQKNLSKGRFLLMILGDGIRENMEEISNYIHRNGNLNFTLCIVELPLYKNSATGEILITPRILAKTKEIERVIYRLEDRSLIEKESEVQGLVNGTGITEKVFFERLESVIGKVRVDEFQKYLAELSSEFGIQPKPGRGKRISLNLKSADDLNNFASVQDNGEVWFYGIINKAEEAGNINVGIEYLKSLAALVGAQFYDKGNKWTWGVRRNGQYVKIDEYLAIKDKWKELIMYTLEALCIEEAEM